MTADRPLRTGREDDLDFHKLSPEGFEKLCVWLLEAEGFRNVEHYGASGSDGGRDVTATDPEGRFTVVQCKRYRPTSSFGVDAAGEEVDKVLNPKPKEGRALPKPVEHYILVVTRSISADVRQTVDQRLGTIPSTFWDLTWLDHRVRQSPTILKRFFELPTESKRRRFNLPVQNGYFKGRDKDLADLAERLRKRRAAAITQAITGLGGIGKTQTAIEYCYRHGDAYQDLFWCDASSVENLQRDYAVAAQTVGVAGAEIADNEAAGGFLDWLAGRATSWLVVLDNADDPDQVVDLVPRGPKGHVLVTSRAAHLPNFGAADPIILDVLGRDDALAFLLQRSGREQDEAASELIEELGRLPLAIEQAAAYLGVHRTVSIRQYLDAFDAKRLAILEKAKPGEGSYHSTVAATWRLNIEEVEDGSPAAAEVMRGLAFVAPDAIPVELIHMGLSCFGRVAQEVAGAAEGDTLEIAAQIVEPLTRYSLLRSDDARGSTLAIHRLVQEVIRSSLDAEGAQSCWSAALKALETIAPDGRGDDSSSWPAWRAVVGHIIAHAGLIEPADAEPTGLWYRTGWFALQSGAYRESQRLYEREFEVRRRGLGEEHPSTLTAMANLASTLSNQGEWSEARTLEEQVVQASRRVLGEEHPSTLTAMANLASTLWNQGEWSEARTLFEQVVQVSRRGLGEEHPHTLTAMNNLASTLRKQGEWSEARTLFEQVVQVRRRGLGEEHPHTLTAMNNLASTLWNQGEWSEARTLFEQVVQVSRRILGEEHPDTLTAMNNLAHTLKDQGEWAEAKTLFEQVVEAFRRVVGPEHPHTKTVEANRASLLEAIENASEI